MNNQHRRRITEGEKKREKYNDNDNE